MVVFLVVRSRGASPGRGGVSALALARRPALFRDARPPRGCFGGSAVGGAFGEPSSGCPSGGGSAFALVSRAKTRLSNESRCGAVDQGVAAAAALWTSRTSDRGRQGRGDRSGADVPPPAWRRRTRPSSGGGCGFRQGSLDAVAAALERLTHAHAVAAAEADVVQREEPCAAVAADAVERMERLLLQAGGG